MRGTDYIKSDYENEYLLERENLSDRIIEAQYNMLFLEAVCNKRDNYKEEDLTNKFEILIVLKRIYISVVWELVMQIKAYIDDNDKDTLTIEKFKNKVISSYIIEEKKEEVLEGLAKLKWKSNKQQRQIYIEAISEYRNKIVCHNFKHSPALSMDIRWMRIVIDDSIELLEYLNFGDVEFQERLKDLQDEKKAFIDLFLSKLYE